MKNVSKACFFLFLLFVLGITWSSCSGKDDIPTPAPGLEEPGDVEKERYT